MRLEEYLRTVTDQIRCAGARSMVEEELREHIQDQAEAYEADGMFEEEALERAVREMGDPVETGVSLDRVHRPHMSWGMLALVSVLALTGVVFQAALSAGGLDADGAQYWFSGHIRYTLMGMLVMLAVYRLDYSILAGRARLAAGAYLVFLLFGWFVLGRNYGSYVWIDLGVTRLSGMAALYLFIPLYGALLYDYRGIGYRKLWKLFLWALAPVWLAFRLPSIVTVVILAAAFVLLFSIAVWHGWYQVGRKKTLAVLWAGMAVLPPALFGLRAAMGGIAEYQMARIMAFLGRAPEAAYTQTMAGNFLSGSAAAGGNPENVLRLWTSLPGFNSDYAFVSLITTYGVLAGILAAALMAYLIFRIFRISLRQRNQLGMILGCASGITIFLQTVMHIMVNLNLLPFVSVNMPFFSVGGSQMMVSYILLGIVLSVYRYKDIRPEKRIRKKIQETA